MYPVSSSLRPVRERIAPPSQSAPPSHCTFIASCTSFTDIAVGFISKLENFFNETSLASH